MLTGVFTCFEHRRGVGVQGKSEGGEAHDTRLDGCTDTRRPGLCKPRRRHAAAGHHRSRQVERRPPAAHTRPGNGPCRSEAPRRGRSGHRGWPRSRGRAAPGSGGSRRHPAGTLPAVRRAGSAGHQRGHEEPRLGATAAHAPKKRFPPRHQSAPRSRGHGPPSARRGTRLLPRLCSWSTTPAATTPGPGTMAVPRVGRVPPVPSRGKAGPRSRGSGGWGS